MELEKLIEENPNITIAIKASDLEKWLKGMAEIIAKANEEKLAAENGETYLSAGKVTRMLEIDRSTLWRWEKTGYLVPVRVGGKVRYKMADIKTLIDKKGGKI